MQFTRSFLRSKHIFYSFRCFSAASKHQYDRYKVHILPALTDNYMYILTDKLLKFGIAVDPVEPNKVLKVLQDEKLDLKAVLTTHHHFDHAGGNKLISQMLEPNNLSIYGGDDRIESLNIKVSHNEVIKIGDFVIKCMHTPCHTSGHFCYFIEADNSFGPICFSGDTLFVGGCGRFFEGSAKDMLNSLNILSKLPAGTKVFCGHEYTTSNLKFALSVEPNCVAALEKMQIVHEKLKCGKPSVPSTIEEELSYNPFLRTNEKSIQHYTNEVDPIAIMARLRKAKDNF